MAAVSRRALLLPALLLLRTPIATALEQLCRREEDCETLDAGVELLQAGLSIHAESESDLNGTLAELKDVSAEEGSSHIGACLDEEFADDVGPIVSSIAKFWSNRNITVYPFVLTGLNALRYGGTGVAGPNKEQQTFDHDMDFLVQMPNATYADAQKMVQELQNQLFMETSLASHDITMTEFGLPLLHAKLEPRLARYRQLDQMNIWVLVKQKSAAGRLFSQSDIIERLWDKFLTNEESVSRESWINKFRWIFDLGYTMVDFWVKLGDPLGADYQAAPGVNMSFQGAAFPAPKKHERNLHRGCAQLPSRSQDLQHQLNL